MTRRHSASETERMARAKRTLALQRSELRGTTTPTRPAAGVTSAPLKVVDPAIQAMIDEFDARRTT